MTQRVLASGATTRRKVRHAALLCAVAGSVHRGWMATARRSMVSSCAATSQSSEPVSFGSPAVHPLSARSPLIDSLFVAHPLSAIERAAARFVHHCARAFNGDERERHRRMSADGGG